MDFLTAIPVIGSLFDKLGKAIDRNVTSDEERLKLKAEIMATYTPVLQAITDAQSEALKAQVRIAEIEAQSDDRFVRWRRPIIAFMAIGNLIAAGLTGYMDVDSALYLALVVNGLDTGTRGLEKVVRGMKAKERI